MSEKHYDADCITYYGHLANLALNNPIFVEVKLNEYTDIINVCLAAKIAQYGENQSILYEDIARELFCPNSQIHYYTAAFNLILDF